MITKIFFIVVNNFVHAAVKAEGLLYHATRLKIKMYTKTPPTRTMTQTTNKLAFSSKCV